MRRRTALGLAVLGALILLLLLAAVPVATIELACGRGVSSPAVPAVVMADPADRRPAGESYMTFPEWDIVYAYADLAAVTHRSSESDFGYGHAVAAYWSSLCRATATARAIGPVTLDQRVTNDIIGLSFTLEMVLQGAYEETIGALTTWSRGPDKTPEDTFNQRFLDDYAAFLHQTPWYSYPFARELARFWRETPWSFQAPVRSLERRVALSLEYGLKALYAIPMRLLASASPADLSIVSVVEGGDPRGPGTTSVRDLGGDRLLVRTPRYEAYSEILKGWAASGTKVIEIAGDVRVLITVLAPEGTPPALPGATPIFGMPVQDRSGWQRVGYDVAVPHLTDAIQAAGRLGTTFEHAYDP